MYISRRYGGGRHTASGSRDVQEIEAWDAAAADDDDDDDVVSVEVQR